MKPKLRKLLIIIVSFSFMMAIVLWSSWRPAKRFEYTATTENQVRVMTWNVGYFSIFKNKNMRNIDMQSVTTLIEKSGSDVVVLQELNSTTQAKSIADSLGEKWTDYSINTGHGKQTLSVLSRFENNGFDVEECGGRNIISTSFLGPQNINIIGVHSPHPARGLEATKTNIQCALRVSSAKKENIRIITGDMNYDIDPQKNQSDLYQEIMQTYGDGTIELGETYYAQTRIDHMFHYPKTLTINQTSSGLIDLPWRFAKVSGHRDHRPIVVTYNLPK